LSALQADTCSGRVLKFDMQIGHVFVDIERGTGPSPGNNALGGVNI
jgi:hypothetical protein